MNNLIPTYIVTGFLSSGKTKFINQILNNFTGKTFIIQFESGFSTIITDKQNIEILNINIHEIKDYNALAQEIITTINNNKFKQIIIEFNGMCNFDILENIIYNTKLVNILKIKDNIYITNPNFILNQLNLLGTSQISQIYNADKVNLITTNSTIKDIKEAKKRLKAINLKIKFYNDYGTINKLSSYLNISTISVALIIFILLIWVKIIPTSPQFIKGLSIITGVCLESFPFLLLGAFFSALLQNFTSIQQIERLLKSNPLKAGLIAIFQGIFIPICDCGIINVFRALVNRKVPLPIAILYLLATPFMNPFVALSTYYAFSGNLAIVITRISLALIIAIIVSLSFIGYKKNPLLKTANINIDLENTTIYSRNNNKNSKYINIINHTQAEFLNMSKYVILGATISALFQIYCWPYLINFSFTQISLFAIFIAYIFAFLLSLCATADAMVASSLINQLSYKGIFGFMLLGPVFDLKNFLLLKKLFTKNFIYRFALTTIITITTVIYLASFMTSITGVRL